MKLPRGRVHHGTRWQFSLLPKALSFRQQRQPVRHRSVAETRRIGRRTEAHHPLERWTVGPCRTWHLETQRRGWSDRFRRWKMGAPGRDGGAPLISLFASPRSASESSIDRPFPPVWQSTGCRATTTLRSEHGINRRSGFGVQGAIAPPSSNFLQRSAGCHVDGYSTGISPRERGVRTYITPRCKSVTANQWLPNSELEILA